MPGKPSTGAGGDTDGPPARSRVKVRMPPTAVSPAVPNVIFGSAAHGSIAVLRSVCPVVASIAAPAAGV